MHQHQQRQRQPSSSTQQDGATTTSSRRRQQRRSSIEEETKNQRRLSGWAIFGSVMEEEDQTRTTNGPIYQEPESFLQQHHDYTSFILKKLPASFIKDFRVILKCSIAYLIASLFSFYDPLSDLLVLPFGLEGPFSGAHVVATIVTYYRPAATIGGMIEANHYAFWGLFWLSVIIGGSTLTSVLIQNRIISHAIVIIFFVGFGYGSMAWVKLKSPGFASTCSMIIVISSVIITREGSIHYGYLDFKKSLIYTEIILIGMVISNLTCILFWRGSATKTLQIDINKTLDSFTTLVGMLTKTFLLDDGSIYTDQERIKKAIDRHHLSFTSLKGSLDGASYEFFEPKIQRSLDHYKELIASMNRLAQHLTGLRSGCSLQHELLSNGRPVVPPKSNPPPPPIEDVFKTFCDAIGPSLKTLMATGAACLLGIKTPTKNPKLDPNSNLESGDHDGIDKIINMRSQLFLSLQSFQESHKLAMNQLYSSFIESPSSSSAKIDPSNSWLGTHSHHLNEEIFVICFFLFNMEEFMRELCHLLEIFVDIRADEEVIEYERKLRWSRFNAKLNPINWFKKGDLNYEGRRKPRRARRQRPKLTAVLPLNPKAQRAFRHSFDQEDKSKSNQNEGEQNRSLINSSLDQLKRKIYDFFQIFNDPDTKTSIKIGAGAALLTFPAFWDVTRSTFHHYRAQWAVVTYMIVMASTLGQTNFLVITRMVGTMIGSGVAILAQYAFWQDPLILPIIGFLFSIPCFWLIVCQPAYASTGRFLLLSYNLVCLYSFNVRDKNVHILVTAYNRIICVFVGVLFGWVINSFVWPYKARRELRKSLSEFLLESAFLYSFLVKHYSSKPAGTERRSEEEHIHPQEAQEDEVANLSPEAHERSTLLLGSQAKAQLKSRVDELSKMEMFLQVKLIRLFGLLSATRHEPRLKGRFPKVRYEKILQGCQMMLDMLHSLRAVTVREEWFEQAVRDDFLLEAREEHRELVGNIILFFGLLSSSIELKAPLPPYLPPASESRWRLLYKILDKLPPSHPLTSSSSTTNHHHQPTQDQTQSTNRNQNSDQKQKQTDHHLDDLIEASDERESQETEEESEEGNPRQTESESSSKTASNNACPNEGGASNKKIIHKNINYSLFFAFILAIKHILIQLELVGVEAQSLFGIIGGMQNLSEFEEIFASL
ncbi:hypothetical protein KEM48_010615 [Puccinia striiformis f. sp. tritici PST-130]|nr:hypothetical protein Pst134EB_018697 [Puccinia striiformis f. sp. tritici]KAI9625915.1 hypothetical protein KEM48_010615 [Puccinia striiformis f. sp. tritici PST-130]